ncbi:uncharacterized protein LOC123223518 [Mangifera indica]|uniref:uncharacterized protein LOC123223518 n=1 Tax=Mangifera indica TaxID=29780 RepID=UPI001CFAB26E|nr:uncharacterized protein LOC123223518 [Mangifera indica]XP_044502623.1 uncharacterized protein LOC123223518 [Mangifera indica]XP_044502624.1 uncharacterized protein LOC123223518 [Mangifera indica]XP_044502626.1 uncharacterized protein LOC123223518 [Mangifera indica]XP_044502627.1 uncharacterized protein LOC123223518 [Mangifera indica]
MEEKQLDFNQPFLSVRRFSSTVTTSKVDDKSKTANTVPKTPPLPAYKSELISGPISNPGTVPFVWEKTPGRPKNESKSQTGALERPPIAPKLPPGRILNVKQQPLDKACEGTNSKWSQTGNAQTTSKSVPPADKNAIKRESSKGWMEETESSTTEDGDEAFVDALDTLSRTESFFLNCSVSGVSGLDDAQLKPTGTFSTDPQTRDFMMGRFLPAAKAIASEAPHHTTRKQPIVWEQQPRQIKKVANINKQQPPKQYSSNNVYFHSQHERWEENYDEDDYDVHESSSAVVCGLLPRFCLKSSFCLMNPVPGMRLQEREPLSLGHHRAQATSRSGAEHEKVRLVVREKSSSVGSLSAETQDNKLDLKNKASQIASGGEGHKLDGSSLCRRFQGNVLPPNQNVNCQSTLSNEKKFLEVPESANYLKLNDSDPRRNGTKNFRELLTNESTNRESGLTSPVEKTLYVDSVHKVKSPSSNSSSSDSTRLSDGRGDDLNALVKSMEMDEAASIDSSLHDVKQLNVVDEKGTLEPNVMEFIHSKNLSSPHTAAQGMQIDVKNGSAEDQALTNNLIKLTSTKVAGSEKYDQALQNELQGKLSQHSRGVVQDSISSIRSKMGDERKFDTQKQPLTTKEVSEGLFLQLPLPLPPPTSPSDSWLKRTLPTVSAGKSSTWSSFGTLNFTRVQGSKSPSGDPRWETIVKTSNVHHGHLRFSEELLPAIPEV